MEADVTVAPGLQPRVDEVVAVLLGNRQHAGRVEHHDLVLLQVRRGEVRLAVLGAVDGEQPGLLPQLRHRDLGRGQLLAAPVDRPVTEALALGDKQHPSRLGRLETAGIPDPDLVIRTSGEKRVSNFLLWQLAYAELVFIDTLWPDFSKADLEEAVDEFHRRERRYGANRG